MSEGNPHPGPSRLITASRLREIRACAALDRYKYVQGYRPIRDTSQALEFGTLMHHGLEHWWSAAGSEVRLEGSLMHMASKYAEAPSLDGFTLIAAEELLRGYHFRWDAEPYHTLAVEKRFLAPLLDIDGSLKPLSWSIAGKIDAMARDTLLNCDVTVEHKTTTEDISPGSPYWRRLQMDGQVGTYFEGARSLGYDPMYCLYDVLARPKLRPYAATPDTVKRRKANGELYANQRERNETNEEFRLRLREDIATHPDAYYQRGRITQTPAERAAHYADVFQYTTTIMMYEASLRAPRNSDSCWRWNRPCPFLPVCNGEAVVTDETRYVQGDPHPELA